MKSYLNFSRAIIVLALLCQFSAASFGQTPFWSNNGNNVNVNDKFGSTNNASVTFVTNNVQRMQISAAGNIGIGTTPSALYRLDVNGDANFSGTVHAFGLVLATKAQIDTVRVTNIMSLGNNFNFTGGVLNELYTYSGDVRLQSVPGYNGNVIIGAGTNGNVGIGNYSPAYKLDVNGDVRLSGRTYVNRLEPMPGDSIVRLGDSTIVFSPYRNTIFVTSPVSSAYRGLALGFGSSFQNFNSYYTTAYGLHSVAIGYKVQTGSNAENSVVIGGSSGSALVNNVANSMMIGFNSNVPTIFVSPSYGNNISGYVSIGGEYHPTTTDVNTKLFVMGNMYAADVKVEVVGQFPDYVFQSDYKLMSMDSLSAYVNANKHLPDSKTAADVEQNGMSVSETANSQQKEIEQLTLYILQLNERMKALEEENANLKNGTNH